MVYTVTLNPAIDYIITADAINKGKINPYTGCEYGAGGKGVNVSRMLTSLGVENTAIGVAAGFSGDEIMKLLEQSGCRADFIRIKEGHSRINIKICLPDGQETDFNGEGPEMPDYVFEELAKKLEKMQRGDVLVLAGSVPKTLDDSIYADLIEKIKEKEGQVIVDAAGAALLAALTYRPFLIKPNEEELGNLFDVHIQSSADAEYYANQLIEKGARNVVVSMGEKGSLLVEESGACHFEPAFRGKTVSTVGAGDSMVAGFIYGYQKSGDLKVALRWGTAAGAATAFSKGIAPGALVKALFETAR